MPKVRSEAACDTCQRRKIRCDERLPICSNCARAKRYCDHQRTIRYRHQNRPQPEQRTAESYDCPRDALKDPTAARLFAHYIRHLAAWYDLSDGAMHFATQIPQEAMSRPLLFNAIIAFAAIHLSATNSPSLRATAERYHEQCVQHLLRLSSEDIQHDRGFHLAAVCTLRSYEILAEDFDPNRHLSGAYAFSAAPSPAMDRPSLWRAGFFNYLREDITFSLMNRTALKIDLTDMEIPDSAFDDEDQLNVAALHLAEAVNLRFGEECKTHLCEKVSDRFRRWSESLPSQFTPFYDDTSGVTPAVFPTIRLLRDCHVAVVQYGLVTASLLAENTASSELESTLEANAIRICGLAFTSSSPTVLVNSFGPISYCGCHIRDQALQADLIRRLHSSQKDTGWPVQRMIEGLEKYWNTPRGPQIDATCDSPT